MGGHLMKRDLERPVFKNASKAPHSKRGELVPPRASLLPALMELHSLSVHSCTPPWFDLGMADARGNWLGRT